MDTPEELRQTVRSVVRAWLDGTTGGRYTNEVAAAVLAVPAIADALRAAERDAKVAAAVKWRQGQDDDDTADMVAMAMVISAHEATS